jgi:hypothetical protein
VSRPHYEVATAGIDEAFQLITSDPFGGSSNVGLRVPTTPTNPDGSNRYLMLLASFEVPEGTNARVIGFRQGLWLGAKQTADEGGAPTRVIEQLVTDPAFHLQDGNVSWHMHVLPRGQLPFPGGQSFTPGRRSASFRFSNAPALLYENGSDFGANPYYLTPVSYVPPNSGKPWGTPLRNDLGTFYDLRTEWASHGAWHSMNEPVEGGGDGTIVALFASVKQTDPNSRVALVPPGTIYTGGISAEEQFLLNFPAAVYWRVAGALIVETDDCKR